MARVKNNYRQSRAAPDLQTINGEIETATREVKHFPYRHGWRKRDLAAAGQRTAQEELQPL